MDEEELKRKQKNQRKREYREKNKERMREKDREYYKKNKERILENEKKRRQNPEVAERIRNRRKELHDKNREKIRKQKREYCRKNREKINAAKREKSKDPEVKAKKKEIDKEYYEKNKEKIKKRMQEYKQANRSKVNRCRNEIHYKDTKKYKMIELYDPQNNIKFFLKMVLDLKLSGCTIDLQMDKYYNVALVIKKGATKKIIEELEGFLLKENANYYKYKNKYFFRGIDIYTMSTRKIRILRDEEEYYKHGIFFEAKAKRRIKEG